ncbi:MAG: hypothetical protein IKZ85_04910 [Pseudobutyrivibrio sp.]|nr:hypothetical protein [Pseudobutyrivibrio sp.]
MLEWAKKEVELACKKENPDWDGKSFDYGCSCYQSALEAYKVLIAQNHSGFSWGITRNILMRLMNNQVLTPIEDTEDIWNRVHMSTDDEVYQCTRMSSLFKTVHSDGSITYSDNERDFGIVDNDDVSFISGRCAECVDTLFPITMPYMPETNKYKVLFHNDDDVYPYAVVKPDGEKVYIKCEDTGDENTKYHIVKEED